MNDITSISFAVDPTNVPSFLLDWELTKLCNLDCTYCETGVEYGGHDNTTKHPEIDGCLKSIDFMFAYVDLYMQYKKPSQRKVNLNVYGGESLYHPNIVEILQAVKEKYQPFKDKWFLTVTSTTNAIVGENQWHRIVPLLDNLTLTYHSEANAKQKEIFKRNLINLVSIKKPHTVIILMHNNKDLYKDCLSMIDFCQANNIKHVVKALDNIDNKWAYTTEQFKTLKTFWISKAPAKDQNLFEQVIEDVGAQTCNSINEGRACCGGRQLSINSDLKSRVNFIPKQNFQSWYCSVNWFFLFVQQYTGNVYVNKDCRMNYQGSTGPIGNIDNYQALLDDTELKMKTSSMPVIQCVKTTCMCGFCAPKAQHKEDFKSLIGRHVVANPITF